MRPVLLRQGVLGVKGQSMLPWDPTGKTGPKKPLPDDVSIVEAKDETLPTTLDSKQKSGKPEPLACPSWYPRGAVEWAVGYSLELKEKPFPLEIQNLELLSLQMAFKTTRLDEIIEAEGVGRKEKRPTTVDCKMRQMTPSPAWLR